MQIEPAARVDVDGVDACFDAVVGDGHQAGAHAEATGDPRDDLRHRRSLTQQVGAYHVGREIEISEVEPRVGRTEGSQLLGCPEGLAATSPPAFTIERIAEPVGDRIRIGAHVQAVHDDVVGDVQDHGEIGAVHEPSHATQELPRPDAARQRHDLHRRTA